MTNFGLNKTSKAGRIVIAPRQLVTMLKATINPNVWKAPKSEKINTINPIAMARAVVIIAFPVVSMLLVAAF